MNPSRFVVSLVSLASLASLAALATGSLLLATDRPAQACGGCFSPPRQVTVVTDHRMAFSVSQEQTVLWDQIEYSGQPQDFAWVLPVNPGAQVQLSNDAFFAALDALTAPVITGPAANCGGGGGGFACAGGLGGSASADTPLAGSGGGVQVLSQGVVGPYDAVTLHSTDPTALSDWLVANGYDIPDAIRPVIDAYVAGGFDFIALRLAPGQGVSAMQPVRVVSPGAGLTLPLRMVAAGVGDQVGLTLYVIGEGRYEAQNFPDAVFDDSKLVWLHLQATSNYEPLAEQIMQGDNGRTWLTEFSGPESLAGVPTCSYGNIYGGYGYGPTLADLYFSKCLCSGGALAPDPTLGAAPDAGAADATPSDGATADAAASDAPTSDAPAADASEASAEEASLEEAGRSDGGAAVPEAGASSPSTPACSDFDDLAVAGVGMDLSTTWITRMRAILPANALSEGDLVLQASASQSPVSNQHAALVYDDPSYNPCGQGGGGGACSTTRNQTADASRWLVVGSLGFLGLALLRRRARR
jgi:hypothetical protein